MAHDATKVLLGQTPSSAKEVANMAGSPTTFPAGTAVRLKNDGTISKAKADGELLGISLGKDLGAENRVPIVRRGLEVPILLADSFTPAIGAQVHISDTTGIAGAADTGLTGVNAVYRSGVLTGIKEDGTTANVALIDMQGGL